MTTTRVLVVDDEAPIVDLVRGYLEADGMDVITASDGPSALDLIRARSPDVVILDVNLPGLDGFEVLRQARTFTDAYVMMLTARSEEIDRIVGISVGADDYLVKPFSPRELVVRVKALLRRPRVGRAADGADLLERGELRIDMPKRTVTLRGAPVTVTTVEFNLLATLAEDPGVVFSRQKLLDRVWGMDFVGDDHVVDVHLGNLRRKLGDDAISPTFIETVRGVGYRFRSQEESR
ncbi:MAG: response regulator transcription factor [Chloroflexota bacterium]